MKSLFWCGCGLAAVSQAEAATHHDNWSYSGSTGPEHWGDQSHQFKLCGAGREQSPIDLTQARVSDVSEVKIRWRSIRPSIVNNGHTIQVDVPDGNKVTFEGRTYRLVQFHFHYLSEHTVNGSHFPLEIHFVHKAEDGRLLVLGVFAEEGKPHPTLDAVFGAMPATHGNSALLQNAIMPARLLPGDDATFVYAGSLTTPPCSEVVTWIVYARPIEASGAQIAKFAKLYQGNYRPVQPINRRFLLKNF